ASDLVDDVAYREGAVALAGERADALQRVHVRLDRGAELRDGAIDEVRLAGNQGNEPGERGHAVGGRVAAVQRAGLDDGAALGIAVLVGQDVIVGKDIEGGRRPRDDEAAQRAGDDEPIAEKTGRGADEQRSLLRSVPRRGPSANAADVTHVDLAPRLGLDVVHELASLERAVLQADREAIVLLPTRGNSQE